MRRGIEVVHILHSARNRDDALRDRHR
jgi:hypothetical protein